MRVNERDPAAARARSAGRSFGETLARVRGEGRRDAVGQAERRSGAIAVSTRAGSAGVASTTAGARAEDAAPAEGAGLDAEGTPVRPDRAARDEPRSSEHGIGASSAPTDGAAASDPASLPPLRELVRALPPAIDAARVRDGQPLELSFGTALQVDLRVGRDGVELTLRPDAKLTRAAAAELPGLVRALSSRGVRVARARIGAALDRRSPGGQVVR